MRYQIGGYYSSWKNYSSCKIEEINPTLCTVLYYAFAGINTDGTIKPIDEWADIKKEGYKKFVALKNRNPKLKTLLSIGGWNEGSIKYSDMVSSITSRRAFIDSSLEYMNKYGFDGIDLDWEYPGSRGGKPEDKQNFATLLKEAKEEFRKQGYLLSIAVSISASSIARSYDVKKISEYVDYINFMAYDMHSAAQGKTGENAPLYSSDNDNIHHGITAWISAGCNPQKMILGIPSYGKTFTLKNPEVNFIGAPTTGPGLPGSQSNSPGTLNYAEIVERVRAGWTRTWCNHQQVPYLYEGNQWVGYDDEESINIKIDYLKKHNLGGIMMWAVDMDDPHGLTGTKYPLLKNINSHL